MKSLGTFPYLEHFWLLMQIFTGRADPIEAIRKWEMVVIGSGHEMVPMNKMIMAVMMGM